MLKRASWSLIDSRQMIFIVFFCFIVRSYFTTDGQSVYLGIEHPCGTCDQILLPVRMLLSGICGFVSVERPL
jgi:hypothetical protein